MAHKINIQLDQLHPWMRYKVELWLKRLTKAGYSIVITEGYRSIEKQNELYAQGRTKKGAIITNAKGGNSQHNFGIAVDFALNMDVDGDGDIKDDLWNDSKNHFEKIADIAKTVGLAWGGDWKSIKDKPHIYLPKWGDTPTKIKTQHENFDKFRKTWTATATYKTGTRIRMIPIFTSKVKKIIPKGKKCDVLWKSKLGYSKVKYDGVVGFAKNKHLA